MASNSKIVALGALVLMAVACISTAAAQEKATPSSAQMKTSFAPDPAAAWAPPDVDVTIPPIDPTYECSLPTVLKGAAERVQQLVDTLPKFAATERMQHFEAREAGKWKSPQTVVFDYLVEMKQPRKGMLIMEETRDGGTALMKFPAHLATLGLPALAMVFHPYYADEYEMKCEGLGNWDGFYAWQVHFQQRADKLPRMRGYRIKDQIYPIKLKGRAWISADNFQIVHIDSDLVEPIPAILLFREHLSVDYRPVHFRKENEDLWLPATAEVFMDVRGHRYRRQHSFSDFLMFSVDVDQHDKAPKDQPQ